MRKIGKIEDDECLFDTEARDMCLNTGIEEGIRTSTLF